MVKRNTAGLYGDVFETLQALDPESLDETTRREIEYMLLSDPAADQFNFDQS